MVNGLHFTPLEMDVSSKERSRSSRQFLPFIIFLADLLSQVGGAFAFYRQKRVRKPGTVFTMKMRYHAEVREQIMREILLREFPICLAGHPGVTGAAAIPQFVRQLETELRKHFVIGSGFRVESQKNAVRVVRGWRASGLGVELQPIPDRQDAVSVRLSLGTFQSDPLRRRISAALEWMLTYVLGAAFIVGLFVVTLNCLFKWWGRNFVLAVDEVAIGFSLVACLLLYSVLALVVVLLIKAIFCAFDQLLWLAFGWRVQEAEIQRFEDAARAILTQ